MITWIGLAAGEIWRYLDAHEGKVRFTDLAKSLDVPRDTLLMATGWLAREGYVRLDGRLEEFTVELLAANKPRSS